MRQQSSFEAAEKIVNSAH